MRQVRAAGSYRVIDLLMIEQRPNDAKLVERQFAALRDRATTRDGVSQHLAPARAHAACSDASCRTSAAVITVENAQSQIPIHADRCGGNEEETFFKIKSTTVLAKVFRAYAKVVGGREGQKSMSNSGCFTLMRLSRGTDRGLADGRRPRSQDGSIIDAILYAEHPAAREHLAFAFRSRKLRLPTSTSRFTTDEPGRWRRGHGRVASRSIGRPRSLSRA